MDRFLFWPDLVPVVEVSFPLPEVVVDGDDATEAVVLEDLFVAVVVEDFEDLFIVEVVEDFEDVEALAAAEDFEDVAVPAVDNFDDAVAVVDLEDVDVD